MLQKEGGGYSRVARVGIEAGAVLSGIQENFRQPAVLEAADAGRVADAAVLEVERAHARGGSADDRAGSFEFVQAVAHRAKSRLVVLAVDGDIAGGVLDCRRGLGQGHHGAALQRPDQAARHLVV